MSPRQAQFVPGMTVEEFEVSFGCPSWCGIAWVFWRVIQSSFDIAESSSGELNGSYNNDQESGGGNPRNHPHHTASDLSFGEDVSNAARQFAGKMEKYKSSISKISRRNTNCGAPALDPEAYSRRMEFLTPKCMEIVNLAVMSSEEVKLMVWRTWETMEKVALGQEGGNRAAANFLVKVVGEAAKRVGSLENNNNIYLMHLPVNQASNEGSGNVGQTGEQLSQNNQNGEKSLVEGLWDCNGSSSGWPSGPVPPPPPPLPTRSHELLHRRELPTSTERRILQRQRELQRGMQLALGVKDVLEKLKRKEVFKPVAFDKRIVAGGEVGGAHGLGKERNGVGKNSSFVSGRGLDANKTVVCDVDGMSMR